MNKSGYLEVIAGPMYCGKTEELIRLIKRAVIGKKKIQVFKPKLDDRYGNEGKLHSHAGISFNSELITSPEQVMEKLKKETEIVVIDEAQWLGEILIKIVNKLLEKNIYVIVSGLAMTFDRQPFVPIPQLMAMADKVTKLSAICSICGRDAVFHKRVTKKGPNVNPLIADPGFVSKMDESVFQARCRKCFDK